jgi:diguanylate cyclase (GGDEF)-like protein
MRFDGRRFVRFGPPGEPAFRSGWITALAEDREGLWIGTVTGVVRKTGQRFRHFGTAEGLASERVSALLVDRTGVLWAGTEQGLQRLAGGRFSAPNPEVPARKVTALVEASDGVLWAAAGSELCRVDPAGGSGLPLRLPGDARALEAAPGGGVWVGGGYGLSRVRVGRDGAEVQGIDGLAELGVGALHADPSGALWVGTLRDGLRRLGDGRVEKRTKAEGFPAKSVFSIARDVEGNLWLGLDRGGLVRLTAGSFSTFGNLEGLPVETAFSVREGPGSEMWITSDLGLSRIDPSGQVDTYGGSPPAGPGPFSSALLVEPEGELLVGTFAEGLFAGRPGSFRRVASGARLASIRVLLRDAAGILWVGSSAGLFRVEGERVERVEGVTSPVFCLSPDGEGGLLAGSRAGLLTLSADGTLGHLPLETGKDVREVRSLCRDRAGRVWFGTDDGLGVVAAGRLKMLRRADGLASDSVYGIVEDDEGNLWTSSNEGVFRLPLREALDFFEGRSRQVWGELFGRADGLRNPECMGGVQPSAWKARDGRLWFAAMGGAVVVDPRHLPGRRRPPRVVVEEVRIDGRPYEHGSAIEAPPGAGRLEIAFAGLSLMSPERVRFRHRLGGFEKEWTDTGSRREVFYTNLPPGRYRFEVNARHGNGDWSAEGAVVELALLPRFTQTRGFLALVLAAGLFAVVSAHLWRTVALRRRQRQLEQVVDERTRDLRGAMDRLAEVNLELEGANRTLERLSLVDGLTGVSNRRHFDDRLRAEWARAVRSGEPVALALFDVDHFKAYNDTYGHQAGDRCLVQVAGALGSSVHRPGDVVGRYGGEEFVALLPGLDLVSAATFAENLRRRVEALSLEHASSSAAPHVTVSAGVASARPNAQTQAAALVAAADAALYAAKREGRNRVVLG